MKSLFPVVAALMLAIATAHAEYFPYSDWSKQPADFRAAYIAGLYDALVSMAETNAEAKIGAHYQACVRGQKCVTANWLRARCFMDLRDLSFNRAELARL
jgi:hypothetical protein